jgi:hypothetical protein
MKPDRHHDHHHDGDAELKEVPTGVDQPAEDETGP